jgi:uncharacterized RDD family membrane protein YckC
LLPSECFQPRLAAAETSCNCTREVVEAGFYSVERVKLLLVKKPVRAAAARSREEGLERMGKSPEGEFEAKDLTKVQRPAYPVAGFWIRAAAFAMDVILLNFFAYLLIFVLKEQLFHLGYYCGFLGVFINLGYFVFFNGPLGKGKTPGKYFLNLTVVRWSGEPLDLRQAVIRTAIQLNFFLVLNFFVPLLIGDVTSFREMVAIGVVRNLVFALFVANAILVATHPFKCGIHDLAVRSYVARDPRRLDIPAVLAGEGERMTRWQRSAFQSAGIAFIVIFVLFIFNASRDFLSAEGHRRFDMYNDMKAKFHIEGFEFARPNLVPERPEKPPEQAAGQQGTRAEQKPPPARRDSSATSATAASGVPARGDVEFIYICYGRIDPEQMKKNPAIGRALQRAREWVEKDLPPLLEESKQTFQALNVKLSFHEVISLSTYFYAYDKLGYEVAEKLK